MGVEDIRIKLYFRGDPRRRVLWRALPGHDTTGYVVDLWLGVAMDPRIRSNGVLTGWGADDIEHLASFRGELGALTAALVAAEYLVITNPGATVPEYALKDWPFEQPHIAQYDAWMAAAKAGGSEGGRRSGISRRQKKEPPDSTPPSKGGVREAVQGAREAPTDRTHDTVPDRLHPSPVRTNRDGEHEGEPTVDLSEVRKRAADAAAPAHVSRPAKVARKAKA